MISGNVKTIGLDPAAEAKTLGRLARDLPATLEVAMRSAVGLMVRTVAKEKLLGQILKRQTGTLIRSVTASRRVKTMGGRIFGSFGTNLWYGVAHEQGYAGPVNVPVHVVGAHQVAGHPVAAHSVTAHTRKTKGGYTQVQGHTVKGHAVKAHQVKEHLVRAHVAQVNIRPRRYLSGTLQEKSAEATRRFRRAVDLLAREGKIPNIGRLASGGGA